MMGSAKCEKVSSFGMVFLESHEIAIVIDSRSEGSLKHFRSSEKPPGASDRCLSCSIEQNCAYSAKKIYLEQVQFGNTGWPVNVITENPTVESVTEALKTGPYGR